VRQAAATNFCNLALRKLWTFEAAKVAEAETLMRQAYDIDSNGVYLAWTAFIRMARVIERNEHPDAAFLEEVDCLMRQALELTPDNAMALALIALTRALLFDDLEAGVRMASDALQSNSANLLARQALAVAGSARGDTGQAHRLSVFCRSAVGTDQGRHLWELYHALICLSDGRIDEAMAAAQLAAAQCPNFVAPRRLLVALYAWRGDVDGVEKQLAALARLEPGFTLDAYLRDDRYPVDTLRRANLLRHAASIFGR
jgi:tetratricopeptide (TPR) repeat protein